MKLIRTYLSAAAILLAVCAAAVFLYTPQQAAAPHAPQQQASLAGTISLSIDGLYSAKQVAIAPDETVLGVLQALDSTDPQLQLGTQEYAGLGTLVVSMHGKKNGTGKNYWQYDVNGVEPQIGAGEYKLKVGDSLEWRFSPSQE